jgi:hypothetical protein
MARNLVGITLYLDPVLLSEINSNIRGKSQSEKIRRVLELGCEIITLQRQSAAEAQKLSEFEEVTS